MRISTGLAALLSGLRFLTASCSAQPMPTVSATFTGAPQPVFDTRTQACERIDIPDAGARAFRDDRNEIHLIATHYVARALVGPTLDAVKPNCEVIYRSPEDPNPGHFQYRNWLMSFYSEDGRRIAALVHSEFQGWDIPGACKAPRFESQQRFNCWWNSVTFAESNNGGALFTEPAPPKNLIASIPYPYSESNTSGAVGYWSPTKIVKFGGHYFSLINNWPYRAQKYGPCLIRTADVFDPASWRAWDGQGFSVRFINPYTEAHEPPERHVCAPVFAGVVQDLAVHLASSVYLVTQFTSDRRFGPPGLYLSASADLIHWSEPTLIVTTETMISKEPVGKWSYDYFTLLDPNSPDRNFSTVTNIPYIYFVRIDNLRPLTRVLFRQKAVIHIQGQHQQ